MAEDVSNGVAAKGANAEIEIYNEIHRAIAERRLMPGEKLTEETLVDVFKVSRARIRKVLLLLAKENVVQLEPNRGAFVWRPTVRDAQNVLEARRIVELELCRKAAQLAGRSDLKRLRAIIADERQALSRGDREQIMHLSGKFHVALAETAGNPILSDFLNSLISRCYLILATYQRHDHSNCPQDDHTEIVDALANNDPERAAAAMAEHFRHIEAELDLSESSKTRQNLREVFRVSGAA